MMDDFSELIRAAASSEPTPSPELEHRVMIRVAHRAIERSRRRVRRGMIASLAGLAMLLAGCVAALVVWFPSLVPAFTTHEWFARLRNPFVGLFETTAIPWLEQWGGPLVITLVIAAGGGFMWYLNNLLSEVDS
jgi:hypothetical protein